MTAPTLRRPPRWTDVVLAEARLMLRPRLLAGMLVVLVVLMLRASRRMPMGDLTALMFFFPLLHWRGRAERGSLDQALPAGPVAHDLVRVACGAAGAGLLLCILTAIHVQLFYFAFQKGGIPARVAPAYPATVVVLGIAAYLMGSAIMLRARRPARVLAAVFIAAAFVALSTQFATVGSVLTTRYRPDGTTQYVTYGTVLSLPSALLRLGIGAAAVWLASFVGRHGSPLPRLLRWGNGWVVRSPAPARVRLLRRVQRGPRTPASLGAVAARQFALAGGRMAWLLAAAAALAVWFGIREVRAGPSYSSIVVDRFPLTFLWFLVFFWPLALWLEERPARGWDQAMPAGAFPRGLLHAAAGLAWLQIALHLILAGCIAGAAAVGTITRLSDIPAPLWPGLPLSFAALYCLGSLPVVLAEHPVPWSLAGFVLVAPGTMALDVAIGGSGFSPGTALSPGNLLRPTMLIGDHVSIAAALLWLPVLALLVAAAIHRRVRLDRRGYAGGLTRVPTT